MANARIKLCNKCGKPIDNHFIAGGVELEGEIGYGSKYDGERYCMDLCADCFDCMSASLLLMISCNDCFASSCA